MEIPGSRARVHAKFYGQGCRRKDSPVQPSRCCFCPVEARRANCVQAEEEHNRVETINCVPKKTPPWADLFNYYIYLSIMDKLPSHPALSPISLIKRRCHLLIIRSLLWP